MSDEVRWEGELPDVVGFPAAGPVADEGLGRHHLGPLPVDTGGIGVAVEAEGDRGQAEGVGEGFGEVPDGAEAPVPVITGFADLPDLGDRLGEVVDGARVVVGALGHGCLLVVSAVNGTAPRWATPLRRSPVRPTRRRRWAVKGGEAVTCDPQRQRRTLEGPLAVAHLLLVASGWAVRPAAGWVAAWMAARRSGATRV